MAAGASVAAKPILPPMQADDSDAEVGEDIHELGGEFPTENAAAVDFGWEDKRPLAGRRLKAAKDKQKKAKSGSFGRWWT